MDTPRIAIDLRVLDRPGIERTGIGRYALESFRALQNARPHWEFSLHTNRPELIGPGDRIAASSTHWPTQFALGRIAWLHQVSPRSSGPQPDLWFGPAFVTPPRWRGPSIVTVHDLVFLARPDLYRGNLAASYVARAVRRSAGAAEAIICPSPAVARRIGEVLGVGPTRVLALPWGIGPKFREQPPEPQGDYALFVGRATERKGLETLCRALRSVVAGGRSIRLVMTHSPRAEHRRALGTDVEVEVVEAPGDTELARLYAGALALVYPSHIEGFGFPVAEAMACGCPVIASDLAEVREWAQDGPRYVEPGDAEALAEALVELASDPARREQMSIRGRELTSDRTWEAYGELAAAAVEAALANGSADR